MNRKIKLKFKIIRNLRSESEPEVKVTIKQEIHHRKILKQTKDRERILKTITKVKIANLMIAIYNLKSNRLFKNRN